MATIKLTKRAVEGLRAPDPSGKQTVAAMLKEKGTRVKAFTLYVVGEGIETCLAAMQSTGQPAWAALSTSGLRTLDLPADVREVIILADGDDPGEAAARDCAWRWKRESRRVRIARPPKGLDFNDLLVGRTPHIEGGVA